MPAETTNLFTAGNIAKELGVSDVKVKKVIKDLGIEPKEKKGVCNYYGKDTMTKIKKALK
jgi:hypothetical protein